jgi:hypothetical protein
MALVEIGTQGMFPDARENETAFEFWRAFDV